MMSSSFSETDLHAVIRKGNLLKDVHMRYILHQLLKATKFLHSGNVIHRDQKPSNILLDADCLVKLCDFGLARSLYQIQEDSGNPALTEYVATRWYRAPEILLASHRYTKGVDMWSIGCILAEMLLGKPLFPGTSTINQIERIMNVIPAPTQEDVLAIRSDYGASVIGRMNARQRIPLLELLPPSCPPEAIDLLSKLLVFNPDKRLTAEEALEHPYVRRFHSVAREPALDYDVILPLDDDIQLSVAEYRNKLYEMILERKTNTRRQKRETRKENAKPSTKTSPDAEEKDTAPPGAHTCHVPGATGEPTPKADSCAQNTQQSTPKPKSPAYNLINHSVTQAGFTHWRGAAQQKKVGSQQSHEPPVSSGATQAVSKGVEPRGKTAPVTRTRSFSLTQQARAAAPNNPLTRKDTIPSTTVSVAAVSARLNQRSPTVQTRDVRSVHKLSKKMFQGVSNVSTTGDPKASLHSYTQAYGTISKSALQNLSLQNASPTNK
ncbi:mitogen-activated protein kinase 15-like [Hyla sarda]|uniref:mitogen-activated protein kinase 15-like n=1 Tax=Hyla sarda TaxID=327740 RepID=UPI0024C2F52A|nr:mitogen-activated protein kinase 15-like [Hyla sarda]